MRQGQTGRPPTYFNLIRNLHAVYAEMVCCMQLWCIRILSFTSVYVSRHLRHLQPTPLISTALGPVVPLPMQPSSDPCQMRHLSNIAKHASRDDALPAANGRAEPRPRKDLIPSLRRSFDSPATFASLSVLPVVILVRRLPSLAARTLQRFPLS
jgi:hypothetical protein